jgi:hypothetical protein
MRPLRFAVARQLALAARRIRPRETPEELAALFGVYWRSINAPLPPGWPAVKGDG